MNINKRIRDYADQAGLSEISTGGGCDYIVYNTDGIDDPTAGIQLVLSCPEGGESPDTITSPAVITVYMQGEWGIPFYDYLFPTAEMAMNAMRSQGFRSAAAWIGLGLIEPGAVDEYINRYCQFTDSQKKAMALSNISYYDFSRSILKDYDVIEFSLRQ